MRDSNVNIDKEQMSRLLDENLRYIKVKLGLRPKCSKQWIRLNSGNINIHKWISQFQAKMNRLIKNCSKLNYN